MSQPELLDECFRLMRSKPHLFSKVIVDAKSQPVGSDGDPLQCGRSLEEIIALVVRAAAKRQFKKRLSPVRKPAPLRRLGFWESLAVSLGLAKPPPVRRLRRKDTRAEKLYQAIQEYLRYEWQAVLLPHYAPLTPVQVTKLGTKLLEIREPSELKAIASTEDTGSNRPHLLFDSALRLMAKETQSIDPDILWRVCQQMDLARLFPEGADVTVLRRVVAQISAVQPAALGLMMPVLGKDVRRFTAFLFVVYAALGEQRFRQIFCQDGQTKVVIHWMDRLAKMEPPPPSLQAMKSVYEPLVSVADAEPTNPTSVADARAEIRAALQRLKTQPEADTPDSGETEQAVTQSASTS